jgi:hypothetical protein
MQTDRTERSRQFFQLRSDIPKMGFKTEEFHLREHNRVALDTYDVDAAPRIRVDGDGAALYPEHLLRATIAEIAHPFQELTGSFLVIIPNLS